jgi:putative colanic acid biosynthesis acetyltransferase WcaF
MNRGPFRSLLWILLRPLFRLSPTPLHGLRRRILGLCGANIAGSTKIRPSVRIDRPWNLTAGRLTIFGDHADLRLAEPLTVGERCVISQFCVVATECLEPDQPPGPPDPFRRRRAPVVVEDDCWIAADSFVMPGAVVRAGTVVGARSLVEAEIPGWSIAVGEPARAIKPRAFVNPPA